MKLKKIPGFIFIALLFTPLTAIAGEVWECRDSFSSSVSSVLLYATVDDEKISGTIKVAGTEYYTIYYTSGFNRRWDFDLNKSGTYKYSLLIEPDGDGIYYDFSSGKKSVKPSMFFKCKQKK